MADAHTIPTHTLNDGLVVPAIGFGTWPMRGPEAVSAIRSALDLGYRLLDSAVNYENEEEVGQAVRESGVAREEIVVTTKVPGRFHERALAIRSVEDSLRRMGLDVLDLVLVHWPNPSRGRSVEVFEALLECKQRGLVRSAGVSNYTERLLDEVVASTGVAPSINQIECHPAFPQVGMLAADERHGIRTQAWSPLARMEPADAAAAGSAGDPIAEIAATHGKSRTQVVLRWHMDRGVIPLPKSSQPDRQAANLDVLDFTLSGEEIEAITALGRPDGRLFDGDPETHEED